MVFPSPTGPFPVLTGPTAVGKTAISLRLAEELGAEIISADSRQIYRELTIGTAKATSEERACVPHHFIDELDLGMPFSAGQFAQQAYQRIEDILSRGRIPLIVGGSTLYLHALQFGLADVPPIDPAVRTGLEERLLAEGSETLFNELSDVDSASAATLDQTKTSRLVRALEVFYGTGRPLSAFQAEQEAPPYAFEVTVLARDRAELYERINQRVDLMLEAGLLDEVKHLLAQGFDPSINALRTIGYQEPIAHLRGDIPYQEMVRLIKRNSRRYAKRQMTWFRRYPSYRWQFF